MRCPWSCVFVCLFVCFLLRFLVWCAYIQASDPHTSSTPQSIQTMLQPHTYTAGDAEENAALLREVLAPGEHKDAKRDSVVLNAGMCVCVRVPFLNLFLRPCPDFFGRGCTFAHASFPSTTLITTPHSGGPLCLRGRAEHRGGGQEGLLRAGQRGGDKEGERGL